MNAASLESIHGIPVTPFDSTGDVDEAQLQGVVERIASSGIEVIVSCGNTSEYASLTVAEVDRVLATTVDAARGALVLAGVGGALKDAVDQTRSGIARGATGVMIHSPSDPYLSDSGLVRYYSTLAAAAEGLVVLYIRRRDLSARVLEPVIALENVVAVKYALPNILGFAEFVRTYGEAIVPLCGLAELWAPYFWLCGARGFTSGLVNVAPELSLRMLTALQAGSFDEAMAVWRLVAPFEHLRARENNGLNVSVVKSAMAQLGVIESAAVRPPISPLREHEEDELAAILAGWGVRA